MMKTIVDDDDDDGDADDDNEDRKTPLSLVGATCFATHSHCAQESLQSTNT